MFNLPNLAKFKDDSTWSSHYGLLDNILDHYGKLFPRLDLSEQDTAYLLDVDLPGMEQKNIEIKLADDKLTIKGKKETTSDQKDTNYYRQERFVGTFARSITLPNDIKRDDISASFKAGVLHITIPKNGIKKETVKITIKD